MLCIKNIYVLKYIFVVYKNICGVKLASCDKPYYLNGRVTVSLTMLIRLSHESLDVRGFSAESKSRMRSLSDAVVRD